MNFYSFCRNTECTDAWVFLKFVVKEESKQTVFAENILSKRSISHASSKITTEKSKHNYVKKFFLQFIPKCSVTNTNMVKTKEQEQDRGTWKHRWKRCFKQDVKNLTSQVRLRNSVPDRINHRKSHCYKHSKIAPNEPQHLDRKGR